MAAQGQEAVFRPDVPDLDWGVGPGGGQAAAVGAEGDRQDRPLMAGEGADEAVGVGLAQPNLVPLAGPASSQPSGL
jgi:hypothetical protein